MTRIYLSPMASFFAKAGLLFVECLIGLYNLITFPIRKITRKAFGYITLVYGALYAAMFHSELKDHLAVFFAVVIGFAACIIAARLTYNVLKKKVSPKVAYLINSPLGIPVNRYHKI